MRHTRQGRSSMTKKILHIFSCLSQAQEKSQTLTTTAFLKSEFIELDFCALVNKHELHTNNHVSSDAIITIKSGISALGKLYRLFKSNHYSAVHVHMAMDAAPILLAARLAGIKQRIVHFERQQTSVKPVSRSRINYAILNRVATDIIGDCDNILTEYWRKDWLRDTRCRVIYSGIKAVDFHRQQVFFWERFNLQINIPKIVNVADMTAEKNHSFMVEVLAQYIEKFGPAYLILAGKEDAKIKAQLISKAKALNCDNFMVFLHDKAEMNSFYHHSDVMLYPSTSESFSRHIIDAAATGLPVVASDIDGINEIAKHLLGVRVLNIEEPALEWASAINQAYKFPKDERALNHFNFQHSVFSLPKSIEAISNVYGNTNKPTTEETLI